jgi:hypothetical protein
MTFGPCGGGPPTTLCAFGKPHTAASRSALRPGGHSRACRVDRPPPHPLPTLMPRRDFRSLDLPQPTPRQYAVGGPGATADREGDAVLPAGASSRLRSGGKRGKTGHGRHGQNVISGRLPFQLHFGENHLSRNSCLNESPSKEATSPSPAHTSEQPWGLQSERFLIYINHIGETFFW